MNFNGVHQSVLDQHRMDRGSQCFQHVVEVGTYGAPQVAVTGAEDDGFEPSRLQQERDSRESSILVLSIEGH